MEENNYTLEQMRSDYQNLKEVLANQQIINDRLLRETMRGKVGVIKSKAIISIACAVFVILMAPFVFHYNPMINASWVFIIVTELLMIFCLYKDWSIGHKVQGADLASCDLLTFSKDVKELKQKYRNWTKWGLTVGVLWAIWLCAEVWFRAEEPKLAIPMLVGIAVGMTIGLIFGLKMNNQVIEACDDIIAQINE